jgi:hypothetical protein
MAPHILNPGTRWSASRPARFYPAKGPQYPLNRRLGGVHNRPRRFGEEKILSTLPRIEARIKIITYVLQSFHCKINFPSLLDVTVAHRACLSQADHMFSYQQISYPKIFVLKFYVHFLFVDN